MSKEISLSKESNMIIDFTKELVSQYNDSLDSELKNFKYKINLNDSYERLVYFTNGKKMHKYTNRIKNSLKIDILNNMKDSKDSDTFVMNYVVNVLKEVNIQSTIINDLVDYMFRQKNHIKGIYRSEYDLNIADNSDLHFTRDCLEIDYILLSKPLLNYLENSDDNKIDSFYRIVNDLRVIGNELSKQELKENEYKVLRKRFI